MSANVKVTYRLEQSIQSKKISYFLLYLIAILGPICFFIYTTWIEPRPYFVREMDLEPDYFFNSLMVYSGNPVPGYQHPGTPIYYLGALLLTLSSGANFNQAQDFFNLSYLIVALMTAVAMAAFVWLVLRYTPIGISMLCLASILVWPPLLTYANYFGSESFIVAFGLPTIAVFWKSLEVSGIVQKQLLFVCGIGLGLGLATKMTFLPLAIAIGLASVIGVFLRGSLNSHSLRKSITQLIPEVVGRLSWITLGTVLSFIIFTAPISSRLFALAYRTLKRPEAYPSGSLMNGFIKVYGYLFEANWLFAVFVAALLGFFCVALVRYVWAWLISNRSLEQEPQRSLEENKFDYATAGVFLALLTSGFLYSIASSSVVVEGYEAGIGLRNVSPCALFMPFMIIYVWNILGKNVILNKNSQRWFQHSVVLLAILLIMNGLNFHLTRRAQFIEDQKALGATIETRLAELRAPNTKIAFWNGVSKDIIGREASFHFYGNYAYAFNYFDNDLLKIYPRYTLFNMPYATDMPWVIQELDRTTPKSKYGSLGSALWRLILAGPYTTSHQIFTGGEGTVIPGSVIVFPESELHRLLKVAQSESPSDGVTEVDLLNRIREKTGAREISSESIKGTRYYVLLK